MKKLNVIIILIDGGRLDRIMNSNYFQSLKSKFSFFSNLITYVMEQEQEQIVTGQHTSLKKIDLKL